MTKYSFSINRKNCQILVQIQEQKKTHFSKVQEVKENPFISSARSFKVPLHSPVSKSKVVIIYSLVPKMSHFRSTDG